MKIGKFVILSIISSIIMGCSSLPEISMSSQDRVFTSEDEVLLSQKQIKNKIIQFISEHYYSPKERIDSETDSLISFNDRFVVGNTKPQSVGRVSFIYQFEDNKVITKIVVKDICYYENSTFYTYEPRYWGNFSEELKKKFLELHSVVMQQLKK